MTAPKGCPTPPRIAEESMRPLAPRLGTIQQMLPPAIDLNDVVLSTIALFRGFVGNAIAVNTRLAPRLVPVRVDPREVQGVLIGLAVSARDAMPGAGRLTIETANVGLDPARDDAGLALLHRRYVQLTIACTGIDMPGALAPSGAELLGRDGGTGLWRVSVYRFVSRSGAKASIKCEARRGTTIRLYVPTDADAQEIPG
jgi:hypothetical protein